jgi:two-component system cell cycle response regulator
MARRNEQAASGWSVVIIDDNPELLASTARLLRREGHEVTTFEDPCLALDELRRGRRADLILVDYFMPEMTGEDFVLGLRKFEPRLQVVLQTGYATEQAPREMLRRLDIQGYFDKAEGPDKLLLWVDICLRAARTIRELEAQIAGGTLLAANGS